ncbi:hypothetical protein PIROE2DRAFT_14154 [Piromyces sp. E2]|nr:hypothetical protein PIROE2DRAFT_14154 [Piromyces sp. E2]|eukprot:OUM60163.1 hypothetical protein PIROE2DRAFT_14154 [Piromyces sp. E2]
MLTQCFIYILLLFVFIVNCYGDTLLKEHVVTKENNTKFINIKKVDRDYNVEKESQVGKKSYSDFYQNLIFYDNNREFVSTSWNIYAKTRGTKVYTVNRNRNSNICNKMRHYYNIPLVIEFAENGLISFEYKYYMDIEKMDAFIAYINHLHPQYTISVAYLTKKYEYNEIEMMEQTITIFNNFLIRNNGPKNFIYIGHSMFLPDDIVFYSDEGGVNTDYIYLTGIGLTNINRNGYFSITSLTSILNFSLISSSNYVDIEFTINTSAGDYSTMHTIVTNNSVISIMFDFRNFHGYNFLTSDTESISFSFQTNDPNGIFRVRQIIGHIRYPEDRNFDYVFNRYKNRTYEPLYFEVEDTMKYIDNQCLIITGNDPLTNNRDLKKSIIFACICGAFIILINIILLFKFKVFRDEPKVVSKY